MDNGTFHIEIALGNAAMQSAEDIANALRSVARVMEEGARITGAILDDNGNRVGTYWTEED